MLPSANNLVYWKNACYKFISEIKCVVVWCSPPPQMANAFDCNESIFRCSRCFLASLKGRGSPSHRCTLNGYGIKCSLTFVASA